MTADDLRTPPTAPVLNETICQQLAHRTIRAYSEEPVSPEVMETLLEVARHTASSQFFQQFTIIRITDATLREELRAVSGQPYVGGTRGELLIFVVDLARNARIREAAGVSLEPLERTNLFIQAMEDTTLAAQNMVVAAESLGLGTTYLGSLMADPARVIELLGLPERTFPVFGMLVGHPAQDPQFKPRLPLAITVGENVYPELDEAALAEYDATVTNYHDLRSAGEHVASFSSTIATTPGGPGAGSSPVAAVLRSQKLCLS